MANVDPKRIRVQPGPEDTQGESEEQRVERVLRWVRGGEDEPACEPERSDGLSYVPAANALLWRRLGLDDMTSAERRVAIQRMVDES